MGPWGALIMSFFGGFFFVWASVLEGGWRNPLLIVPLAVVAVLTWAALKVIASTPRDVHALSPRAERVISWATAAEGIGIPVIALTLANTGHGAVVLPGIALVVGLHFLPMGWAIPFAPFLLLGGGLLIAACSGFVVAQPAGSMLAGYSSALALWTASALAIRRGRLAS